MGVGHVVIANFGIVETMALTLVKPEFLSGIIFMITAAYHCNSFSP